MATIVILGAGPAGLSTAMLLTRDGHEVTVLERDPAPPDDRATPIDAEPNPTPPPHGYFFRFSALNPPPLILIFDSKPRTGSRCCRRAS